MSLKDTLKGKAGELRGKTGQLKGRAGEFAGRHHETIDRAVDRAAGAADKVTGGRYKKRIQQGSARAKSAVSGQAKKSQRKTSRKK